MTTKSSTSAKISKKDLAKSEKTQDTIKDSQESNDVKSSDKEKKESTPKTTKKSIVISMISVEGGALINDMAQAIVDQGLDPDLEKNKRVVRLWLTKLGMPVKRDKESGKYMKG